MIIPLSFICSGWLGEDSCWYEWIDGGGVGPLLLDQECSPVHSKLFGQMDAHTVSDPSLLISSYS